MNQLINRIIELVESQRGINGRILMSKLVSEFISMSAEEIREVIIDLVAEGEITEIEYVIGTVSESLFVPCNTRIEVSK